MSTEQQEELATLEAQIELKRKELDELRIKEEAKTDRVIIGGVLGVLGLGLLVALATVPTEKRRR